MFTTDLRPIPNAFLGAVHPDHILGVAGEVAVDQIFVGTLFTTTAWTFVAPTCCFGQAMLERVNGGISTHPTTGVQLRHRAWSCRTCGRYVIEPGGYQRTDP